MLTCYSTLAFNWDQILFHQGYVCAHAQKFPSPRWEFLLTCPIDSHLSIRIDIWFYQGFVRASHACKLPIAPMGICLVDMSISILIFDDGCCLDLSVSSTCHLRLKNPKFPIAPMGKMLTRLPRLSLTQLRPMLRSTTALCTCIRD